MVNKYLSKFISEGRTSWKTVFKKIFLLWLEQILKLASNVSSENAKRINGTVFFVLFFF